MNIEEVANKAVNLKLSGKYNCCQAVVCSLKDEVNVDEETLYKLSSGFAIGMGNMEATCGSLVGSSIIASLKLGNGATQYTKQISEKFKEKCGSITCKELKGLNSKDIFCPCEECVRNSIISYGEVIKQ